MANFWPVVPEAVHVPRIVVGGAVGEAVGEAVGDAGVGDEVGEAVGDAGVGAAVGEAKVGDDGGSSDCREEAASMWQYPCSASGPGGTRAGSPLRSSKPLWDKECSAESPPLPP